MKRKIRKVWNILRRNESIKDQYAIEVSNRYDRLTEEVVGKGADKDWQVLQGALVGAAEAVIPKERRRRKNPWITDEILDMMEERRIVKNLSEERYREMDRRILRSCQVKKEEWLNARCKDIEESEKVDPREMAMQIRELSGKKGIVRSTVIKDRNGDILTDREQVLERWRGYVGELYRDQRGNIPDLGDIEPGPPILRGEVEKAIKTMK